jgi:hypothetical protein
MADAHWIVIGKTGPLERKKCGASDDNETTMRMIDEMFEGSESSVPGPCGGVNYTINNHLLTLPPNDYPLRILPPNIYPLKTLYPLICNL